MMITPAILLSSARCCRVACPIELATAPSTMNTRLNPRMNITEFSITERITFESCCLSSSTPAPEISDTYPGTSGSTHGDRNEINPATNAAIGKGNDDIASSSILDATQLRKVRFREGKKVTPCSLKATSCHPERGRAPARLLQRGKPESKDIGFGFVWRGRPRTRTRNAGFQLPDYLI